MWSSSTPSLAVREGAGLVPATAPAVARYPAIPVFFTGVDADLADSAATPTVPPLIVQPPTETGTLGPVSTSSTGFASDSPPGSPTDAAQGYDWGQTYVKLRRASAMM